MAINEVAKEIMWMRIVLREMKVNFLSPTIIFIDNQSAIKISENDTDHDRTKHIDTRYYFIRDLILRGDVKLMWLPTDRRLADILTKPLSGLTFDTLKDH